MTRSKTSLQLAQRLLKSALRLDPSPVPRFEEVLQALDDQKHVLIELPWYSNGQRHLLSLRRREGDRLYFKHTGPKGDAPVGSIIKQGIRRRIEADGTESVSLDDLRRLFESKMCTALRL